MRSLWMKSKPWCPYKDGTGYQGHGRTPERTPWKTGRDWVTQPRPNTASVPGKHQWLGEWHSPSSSPSTSRGNQPRWHLDFGSLALWQWRNKFLLALGHPVQGVLLGKPQETNAGRVCVSVLTYTARVHWEGRHISHVDPLDVLNQQTEQRQVESGYPRLMALEQRCTV